MLYLTSSAIRAVHYDANSMTLTIWFTSGGHGYDYYNVPEWAYTSLVSAPSKGQYFNQHIRDKYAA